jgi:hypothetical protein
MMTRTRTIALAAGLPITLLAVGAQSAAATDAPADSSALGARSALPADWVTLTDDTDTITVAVPNTWTDVDTAPGQAEGTEVPHIEASTNREVYRGTFDAPGVTYHALPFDTDTAGIVDRFGLASGCSNESTGPYDDGAFAGHHLVYTECGSGPTEFHVIAANPANQAFTALLQIQITGPEEQNILATILDTFNMTSAAAATTTTTTVPGGTGTSGTFPPPTGEVPADWTPLVDDSQTITLSVPSAWTDVTTSASASGEPWISATPDASLFVPAAGEADTFSVPGVIYNATGFNADTEAVLLAADVYSDVCTDNGVQEYNDGAFAGSIQTFTNCGGTSARIVQVAANPADGAFTAFLLIQLTGAPDDDATLDGLLSSFNRAGGGAAWHRNQHDNRLI